VAGVSLGGIIYPEINDEQVAALFGYELRRSWVVAEDEIVRTPGVVWVGPLTHFKLTHDGRLPFETRYCRGVLELERDRRRR
jgi:hypothetical protein